jgi:hypothetical protein
MSRACVALYFRDYHLLLDEQAEQFSRDPSEVVRLFEEDST